MGDSPRSNIDVTSLRTIAPPYPRPNGRVGADAADFAVAIDKQALTSHRDQTVGVEHADVLAHRHRPSPEVTGKDAAGEIEHGCDIRVVKRSDVARRRSARGGKPLALHLKNRRTRFGAETIGERWRPADEVGRFAAAERQFQPEVGGAIAVIQHGGERRDVGRIGGDRRVALREVRMSRAQREPDWIPQRVQGSDATSSRPEGSSSPG